MFQRKLFCVVNAVIYIYDIPTALALLAKKLSQQALQGGGNRCGLLLINHNYFCFL